MTLIGDWMDSHAIDRKLAYAIGLRGKGDTLIAPYRKADGSVIKRTRTFPNGKWIQPAGESLCCWWPLGRAHSANVLLLEGEGDTLAAASVLEKTDHPSLNGLCPVGLPGLGAVKVAAAELSAARTKNCYIAFDNDPSQLSGGQEIGQQGQRATEKLCDLLLEVGITPFPVELPKGRDLSDVLVALGPGALSGLLSSAKPRTYVPPEKPPRGVQRPLTASEEGLKDIPAPVWVSRLAGIEEPSVGSLIHCPLHKDKTPSCRVNDTWFYCHGCQRGGSVFDFAMALWRVDFRVAKERLSEIFDVAATSTPPQTTSLTTP